MIEVLDTNPPTNAVAYSTYLSEDMQLRGIKPTVKNLIVELNSRLETISSTGYGIRLENSDLELRIINELIKVLDK